MIIDSHCHAWAYWPYQPPVPDPASRPVMEQLLHEMDANGVSEACVVCAQIDHNPRNNAYVAEWARREPDRLHQIADLDSEWSPHYHSPGGAERLRQLAAEELLAGFTHYLHPKEDGAWLLSEAGQAIFSAAAELDLFASLSCYPHQLAAIRAAAERSPQVPVLLHHLGHPTRGTGSLQENIQQV